MSKIYHIILNDFSGDVLRDGLYDLEAYGLLQDKQEPVEPSFPKREADIELEAAIRKAIASPQLCAGVSESVANHLEAFEQTFYPCMVLGKIYLNINEDID